MWDPPGVVAQDLCQGVMGDLEGVMTHILRMQEGVVEAEYAMRLGLTYRACLEVHLESLGNPAYVMKCR